MSTGQQIVESGNDSFAFAVVGGGPVGAALALGLEQQGHRVALVEAAQPFSTGSANLPESAFDAASVQPFSADNALGVDPRTVALSYATRQFLEPLGAWPEQSIGEFERMEVWEERGTSVLRFAANDVAEQVGCDTLGHIAEVGPWREQLWKVLASSAVTLFTGHTVVGVTPKNPGQLVELSSGADDSRRAIVARTLIAADGGNSAVRRSLGINMMLTDTGQSALAFAARTKQSHERTAFQRFLATGPLALLPMADAHTVSVVWSASNDVAEDLVGLNQQALAVALERATEARLGSIEAVLPAVKFPLRQGVISSFAPQPDVVFVGDAARVVHPLAGQGVNLGFEDVRALLGCTHPDVAQGAVPPITQLQRFARTRRARSRLAVAAMSALAAAYAPQSPGMLLARNMATRVLDRQPLARRTLVLEAMGLGPLARAS